jgi:hypothetical protein
LKREDYSVAPGLMVWLLGAEPAGPLRTFQGFGEEKAVAIELRPEGGMTEVAEAEREPS